MVVFDEEKQDERVRALKEKEEEELASSLASHHGVPYLDLSTHPINIDALRTVKEALAREANMAVFNATDKQIDVAVLSPQNEKTIAVINDLKQRGFIPEIFMVSHASLRRVWERYKDLSYSFETKSGAIDISSDEIIDVAHKAYTLDDIKKHMESVLAMKRAYRVSKLLEIILAGALALKASDVHLEPQEENVRLRYRLNGVLTDIINFDIATYNLILSRIKLVSELKLNVMEKAQDGRFSIRIGESDIEVRTSLLPSPNGESIVLRVLNPESIAVDLDTLGIHPRLLTMLKNEITKPNGLLLTTGPTGSGKTTTLYAFLKKIYNPEIKVITIENPVEYHLKGIVQTQVEPDKGYTFAEGLRSALRQDPDVIMVGEIRDDETAGVAVNAALTGHLVLSTLHTNNAAGSIPRLIDLGVNPKIISSSLTVAIAQRLVRSLCSACKKEIPLEGTDKEVVTRILAGIKDKSYLEGVQTEKVWAPSGVLPDGSGCLQCNGLGFDDRVGVYEAIFMDKKVEEMVITNPSERDIREASKSQMLLTLQEDGVLKVLQGITTITELDRVVDLSE